MVIPAQAVYAPYVTAEQSFVAYYETKQVDVLRKELRHRSLPVSGLKRDLATRLWQADDRAMREEPVMLHELFPKETQMPAPPPASAAQVNYVRMLAGRRGVDIPAAALDDAAAASRFIDQHK